MNKRIGGLDISRNWVILCVLDGFPDPSVSQLFKNLKTIDEWNQRKTQKINEIMWRLEPNQESKDILKGLNLDALIMEPSGMWYAGFWTHLADQLGIKVFWVSHQQVKYSRSHYTLKNKDDRSDALTIAALYFDPGCRNEKGEPPLIANYNHEKINNLRDLFFQREQLEKIENNLVNQLRQRLTKEFPEIAERCLDNISKKTGVNPTLAHIAGIAVNKRIPLETLGVGLSDYTKNHAARLISLKSQVMSIENEMSLILADPEFKHYIKVFRDFGYGVVCQSLILFHVYPFEKFLVMGKPDYKDGKDLSLRKFQAFLGLSYSYEKSGSTSADQGKIRKTWLGSDLVRSHLYIHALVMIAPKSKKAHSSVLKRLKNDWENERIDDTGKKYPSFQSLGKDGLCRLLFLETRLLYRELLKNTL